LQIWHLAVQIPKLQNSSLETDIDMDKERAANSRLELPGGVTLKLVRIPAGTFMMGSPVSEAGREGDEVQHEVTITKPFYMGIYEVTQAQWKAVMGTNPSVVQGDGLPVENMIWDDALEFCRKLSARTGRKVRLPTEAEWEYACRAGTATAFNIGETISTDRANYGGNPKKTTLVGSFGPNAWGLHDMHGNVWEWCSDWYGEYPPGPVSDPIGPGNGSNRILRGGTWFDNPGNCRSANRHKGNSGPRKDYSDGFRVALD
jgi:formylglycine-generating enzyme required for sulfatase activity